ncbi:MAG: hypothetical protein AAF203_08380, partial [Pseudomonadota bacterium]
PEAIRYCDEISRGSHVNTCIKIIALNEITKEQMAACVSVMRGNSHEFQCMRNVISSGATPEHIFTCGSLKSSTWKLNCVGY